VIEDKRKDAREFALEESKPENVIDRIVEGRLKKFLDEVCLMRQPYVRDDELTVEELLMQNIGSIGENIIVRRFERWELGEDTMD
jgi:elongation factor Ts